ncbi:hypothetical protein GOC74_00045 [Halomicrobium mukohataei]|uniref:Type II CBASS E2 protein domain-containing protein n=1 Tax=Halomicrobium mukohataei TaxID=57705 RepID=A0A847UA33_9EURY|nr:ubiquitin-conjugating enzyme E2 [Halomicrobium mukohataei]NLV08340.1 hypothetical protein [Halomicrobium mukohataei]
MRDLLTGTTIKEQTWEASTWYEQDPERLRIEKKVMKERFPQFSIKIHGEELFWEGTLRSNSNNRYEVAIFYPNDYPYSAPEPYITDPDITQYNPPHIYANGQLCVFEQTDGTWERKSTAATMVTLIAPWIGAFEHWQETGYWPGPEAD